MIKRQSTKRKTDKFKKMNSFDDLNVINVEEG